VDRRRVLRDNLEGKVSLRTGLKERLLSAARTGLDGTQDFKEQDSIMETDTHHSGASSTRGDRRSPLAGCRRDHAVESALREPRPRASDRQLVPAVALGIRLGCSCSGSGYDSTGDRSPAAQPGVRAGSPACEDRWRAAALCQQPGFAALLLPGSPGHRAGGWGWRSHRVGHQHGIIHHPRRHRRFLGAVARFSRGHPPHRQDIARADARRGPRPE
jgi:hypothetical protein